MVSESKLQNLWNDIRSSLKGGHQDFTSGSIGRAVTILAIPMVLEMSLQSVFGLVDVFFVGKLGSDAIATVALTEGVLTLIFALGIGLSMGTVALIARRTGEKDIPAARRTAVQAIWLSVAISIPVAVLGYFQTTWILGLMGASDSVVTVGRGYFEVMLATNITIVLLFVINAIFRASGDPVSAMWSLWVANGFNIVLDPLLIFGIGPFPEMGVTGAAVATVAGRAIGIGLQFYILFSPKTRLSLRGVPWTLLPALMIRLIRVSTGGILQYLVATASWLGLIRIVAIFGSNALAGYAIAVRILVFAILPAWGMSNAAATLVGQNLGAGKPERAERSVWITAKANMIFLGLVTVVCVAFAGPISAIFTQDREVLAYATDCLRWVSYGYVFYALGMVTVQSFNGAGDTFTPTVINFVVHWVFQIPLAYILAVPLAFGAIGVFSSIAVAESMLAIVAVMVFRRGTWKERKV